MTAVNQNKELKMTINEIIIEALNDPQNWPDGVLDWNSVDSDLWLHPESKKFSTKEKEDGLDFFPKELVPSLENGGLVERTYVQKNGLEVKWLELSNPRSTHPLP